MAISVGKVTPEVSEFKRYIGVCPVTIEKVNPTKEEFEKLFNTTLNSEFNYVTTFTTPEGKEGKQALIRVIVKPTQEGLPLFPITFVLRNQYNYNKDKTKVEIIDKYGTSTWAKIEEVKNKQIPLSKNGTPLNISKDYHPALIGEADLINFIKIYLNIDSPTFYDSLTGTWGPNTRCTPEECEVYFDDINAFFKGDFSEVVNALSFQPTNKIKILLGIRTDAESGKMYQHVCTKAFARISDVKEKVFTKEVQSLLMYAATSGRTPSVTYEVCPIKEYVVTPTPIEPKESPTPVVEDPFASDDNEDKLPWE